MESLHAEKRPVERHAHESEKSEFFTVEQSQNIEAELREEVESVYEKMLEHPLVIEALSYLDDLPSHLRYHVKDHTLDVMRETILFAVADEAPDEVIERQVIAAAWHDVGFVEKDKENEVIAIEMLKKSETTEALPPEMKEEILKTIRDTEVVIKDGSPRLLKQHSGDGYMLDGDVSNFGREDFREKRHLVADEMNLDLDDIEVKKRFYKFTLDLIKSYKWKTKSAYKLREAGRIRNLEYIQKEYEMLI